MCELVSIIMPSYNTAKYIKNSIESVLSQTYTNWELIIVDDCSTDDTSEIVKTIEDDRIIFFTNTENSGAAFSRNRALKIAKGRWIAFLDSDDLWYPEKLEHQLQFMKKNGYKYSFTDYKIVMGNGVENPYIYTGPKKVTRAKLFQYCYYSTITVMYDAQEVGIIQIENLKKNNDYAMWFEVSKKADCYRLPECLSVYCKHEGSISSGSKLKLIKHHYILYRKGLHKGKVMSVVLTCINIVFGVYKKIYYRKHV